MRDAFWALFGFVLGYAANWWRYDRGERKYRRSQTLPNGIVIKDGMDGRPEAHQTYFEPSPIPRSIAIILLLLGALSIGSSVWLGIRSTHETNARIEATEDSNVANCLLTARLKLSRDISIEANATLASALTQLLSAKTSAEGRQAIENLRDFYQSRSATSTTLPPLSHQAVQDCQDGVYNGPKQK